MVTKSDKSYIETLKIKQGDKSINEVFRKLIYWIANEYNRNAINIYYERINCIGSNVQKRSRLEIIFETKDELNIFYEDKYFKIKEDISNSIINKFREIISLKKHIFSKFNVTEINRDDFFITLSSFKPIYISDINSRIPNYEIDLLKDNYKELDIWQIFKSFGHTTCFVYTDKGLKNSKNEDIFQSLKYDYYKLLKSNDELELINEQDFSFDFDSKENVDENYEGSLFYYYR